MIKSILIDPETQTLTEIEHESTLQALYDALDCKTIDIIGWGPPSSSRGQQLSLVIDDEGLYRETEDDDRLPVTRFLGYGQAIIGRVLVQGPPDAEGEGTSCPVTVEFLRKHIQFSRETPVKPTFQVVSW